MVSDPLSLVSVSVSAGVAVISMDDPARRNALGPAMLLQLGEALTALCWPEVRAVVLRAAPGNSVWCAGFDIGELRPGHDPLSPEGPLQSLFGTIAAFPGPVIAMLNGSAWGGGADLALRCDLAYGQTTSTLAFTPARLGLPYDPDGLLNVLLRGGLGLAMEMFATAEPIDAERALRAGLLNRVMENEALEAVTMATANRIAANAPLSVASAKRQLRAMNAAMPVPPGLLHRLLDERRAALASDDFAEGLAAFREKRPAAFRGC